MLLLLDLQRTETSFKQTDRVISTTLQYLCICSKTFLNLYVIREHRSHTKLLSMAYYTVRYYGKVLLVRGQVPNNPF